MGALVTSNFAKKLFGARWLTFRKKWLSHKKNSMGKIFKIDIFVLKYVLNHSKSIPTKKNFRKIFDFLVTNFSKKWLCLRKKFQWKKIFKIDIIVLKYVLNHSKSIPTKKNFRKIFDFLVTNFSKKTAMSQKKIFNGKNFSKSLFSF